MAQASRDQNNVPTLLGVSNVDGVTPTKVYADPTTHRLLVDIPSGGGTVSSVSVVSANGFAGTVATATTTPAITLSTTITGILSGNGTAISAAVSGTDVKTINGTSILGSGNITTPAGTVTTTGSPATGNLTKFSGSSSVTNGDLSGDITTSGALATTLATVNSNVGSFGSATVSSIVTVNAKGLTTAVTTATITPAVGSITGLGTGIATFLATPSSANLASAVTDETGSGALVFGTNPTIAKPIINATNPTAQTYTPAGGGTATLDLSLSNQHYVTFPAGNITLALSSDTNNQVFYITLTQDSGGSRTVTWFTTIRWAGGTPPTLTTTANKRDAFGFVRTGSGTYDGFIVGQNI